MSFAGPVNTRLSMTFDAHLRPESFTLAGTGQTVWRRYDRDGLITQEGELGVEYVPGTTLVDATKLGRVRVEYAHDAFAELVSQRVLHDGRALFEEEVLERDAIGRIVRLQETLGSSTRELRYTYDSADRLETVRVDGTEVEAYGYDLDGNRRNVLAPGLSGDAAANVLDQVEHQGDVQYAYGANGDRQSRTRAGQTTRYTHDELGALLEVERPGAASVTYEYDPLGRRISKRVGGARVQSFVYIDALKPLAEYDGSGALRAKFFYATRANVPDYMLRGGQRYRIVTDLRGSVRLVVAEATGQVVQRLDYDAYGRVLADTNPGFQPFGYAGGIYDTDTGLVRFGGQDREAWPPFRYRAV